MDFASCMSCPLILVPSKVLCHDNDSRDRSIFLLFLSDSQNDEWFLLQDNLSEAECRVCIIFLFSHEKYHEEQIYCFRANYEDDSERVSQKDNRSQESSRRNCLFLLRLLGVTLSGKSLDSFSTVDDIVMLVSPLLLQDSLYSFVSFLFCRLFITGVIVFLFDFPHLIPVRFSCAFDVLQRKGDSRRKTIHESNNSLCNNSRE